MLRCNNLQGRAYNAELRQTATTFQQGSARSYAENADIKPSISHVFQWLMLTSERDPRF
jgi:hypothetical protein